MAHNTPNSLHHPSSPEVSAEVLPSVLLSVQVQLSTGGWSHPVQKNIPSWLKPFMYISYINDIGRALCDMNLWNIFKKNKYINIFIILHKLHALYKGIIFGKYHHLRHSNHPWGSTSSTWMNQLMVKWLVWVGWWLPRMSCWNWS